MELHKAIKNIILTDGQDILKEMRLVNILDDFNAYQDIPASKYILRAIIADGYTNKLLAIGKWDNAAEALSQKFSAVAGFIPESVSLIFQSIAYGLGWVNSISQSPGGNKQNNQTQSKTGTPLPSRPIIQSGYRKTMTDDEKEEYLFSLLEYDNSKESYFHVKLENLSFEVDSDEEIEIQCEFRRTGKISGNVALYCALYDLRGRMKYTGLVGLIENKDPEQKPISAWWRKPIASQISKIRLYWG